jgi:hypothetical protein
MRDACLQCDGITVEINDAPRVALTVQLLRRQHVVQHLLGIGRDPMLAQCIRTRLGRSAFCKKLDRPTPQTWVGRWPEA